MLKRYLFIIVILITHTACTDQDLLKVVGNLEWDRLELTAENAEPIVEILVREGEHIKAGQVILRMDTERAQAQVDEAIASVNQAKSKLAELVRGAREEKITEMRARLKGAESEAQSAINELARQSTLVQKKLASSETLDTSRAQRDKSIANRDAIKAELQALITGTTIEELDQAKAFTTQAEAHVRLLQVNMERLSVRAPQDGWLDNLPYKLGERPKAGAVVAVMLAGTTPYARVYVPEPLRAKITSKTRAKVYIDGINNPFDGHVRMMSKDPVFTPYYSLTQHDRSRLSYLAEITLDMKDDYSLLSGVPLEVVFMNDGQALH